MLKLTRPSIESPINLDYSNDYDGQDRGLFLVPSPSSERYMRVKSATMHSYGLNIAPAYIQFTLETFESAPVTEEDYLNGVEMSGTFDVLASSVSHVPIAVEYWAKSAYIRYFNVTDTVTPITQDELDAVKSIGDGFTRSMCKSLGDVTCEVIAEYTLSTNGPLVLSEYTCEFTKNGTKVMLDVPLSEIDHHFDPVMYYLDSHREV